MKRVVGGLIRALLLALAIVINSTGAAGASTTELTTDSYTYDEHPDVGRDAPALNVIDRASSRVTGSWERFASSAADGRATSTISSPSVVATNSGGGVVDDLAGAACSFSGSTLVLMADGSRKPIEDVEVGDRVLATDPETGETAARDVTHLWVHQDTVVDLIVDGDVITATEDHPFWNDTDQKWQRADQLDEGDLVRSADGQLLRVDGLEEPTARSATAYNLTVDDIHTYYVGAGDGSVLVHNTCGPLPTQIVGKTTPLTNSEASTLADYLGYRPTNQILRGQRVFTNGKQFIVQDTTSHIGGTWKIADSARALGSKTTRTATTDALLTPIGP